MTRGKGGSAHLIGSKVKLTNKINTNHVRRPRNTPTQQTSPGSYLQPGHKNGWKDFEHFSTTFKHVFENYFSDAVLRLGNI